MTIRAWSTNLIKYFIALNSFYSYGINNFYLFFLEKLDLTYINTNHSIFITKQDLKKLVISTFVNDIKIIGSKGIGESRWN